MTTRATNTDVDRAAAALTATMHTAGLLHPDVHLTRTGAYGRTGIRATDGSGVAPQPPDRRHLPTPGDPVPPRHDLTTVTVPLNTLQPHPRNPRNGDTDVIAARWQLVSGDLPVRAGETVDFTAPRATVAG